jgi:hypothetical protein
MSLSFENVERILSVEASKIQPPPCTYATASWQRALSELDTVHRQGEDRNELYFNGHKYLLHSSTIEVDGNVFIYDFLLERVSTPERWRPLCVIYLDGEDSPCEADDEYLSEEEEYVEYEGRCSVCRADAPRNCELCGIGICDGCSFEKTQCPWCIMDHLEY